ncbi:MAG: sugar-binding domain-containing protein [Anaerolineaceae bacterium]
MKNNPDYTMLYRIAKSYYLDNMSQQQISRRENISRPHVSRLLAKARECGIATVSVEIPQELRMTSLQEELKKGLGLEDVLLVYVPEENQNDSWKVSKNIATIASEHMADLISKARNVGIGWGYTIYQTSLLLPNKALKNTTTFIPLVGMSDEGNPYLQCNVIVDRFAEKFGASSYYTSVPAFNENSTTRQGIESDRYSRLKQQWEKLDTAVIGLGPRFKSGNFLISEASKEYKKLIAESDAVGDILANFFREDGTVLDSSAYYEQVSLPLEQLKKIKTVICMAGGESKVPGIIAAAKNHYIKTLITDNNTAKMIMETLNKSK